MQFLMGREEFLKGLGVVGGVVEKRQSKPILAHILMSAADGVVTMTGTDEEIEMVVQGLVEVREPGAVAVPARKLLDIVRALPSESVIRAQTEEGRLRVSVGKSRFQLSTQPAEDFPNLAHMEWDMSLELTRGQLRRVIEKTQFCMAQQDVRFYLNGLMLETLPGSLKAVGADGHRLAMCMVEVENKELQEKQVIVPRKAVVEMLRFLGNDTGPVEVSFSSNHMRVQQDDMVFVTKLIDGRFPDYHRVIPSVVKEEVVLGRLAFREMLARVGVVSTDKFRGIRLEFKENVVVASARNPDQDEAVEEIENDAPLPSLEMGFNVMYLLEAIGAIESDHIRFGWNEGQSGYRLRPIGDDEGQVYVVMPVRL